MFHFEPTGTPKTESTHKYCPCAPVTLMVPRIREVTHSYAKVIGDPRRVAMRGRRFSGSAHRHYTWSGGYLARCLRRPARVELGIQGRGEMGSWRGPPLVSGGSAGPACHSCLR